MDWIEWKGFQEGRAGNMEQVLVAVGSRAVGLAQGLV